MTYIRMYSFVCCLLLNVVVDELVAKVLQVIEKLMDGSQELLDTWSTPELVSAVYEASSLGRLSPVA